MSRRNGSTRPGRNSSRGRSSSTSSKYRNNSYRKHNYSSAYDQGYSKFSDESNRIYSSQSGNHYSFPSYEYANTNRQPSTYSRSIRNESRMNRNFESTKTSDLSGQLTALEENLLQILHNFSSDSGIFSEIMKKVPLRHTKKDVNQALYNMKKNALVNKCEESPPKWCILEKGKQLRQNKDMATSSSVSSSHQLSKSSCDTPGMHNTSDYLFKQSEQESHASAVKLEPSRFSNVNETEGATFPYDTNVTTNTSNFFEFPAFSSNTVTNVNTNPSERGPCQVELNPCVLKSKINSQGDNILSDVPHSSKDMQINLNMDNKQTPPFYGYSSSSNNKSEDQTEETAMEDYSDLPSLVDSESNEILHHGDAIEHKLLDILSVSQTFTALDVVRKLKNLYSKKQINHTLYAMDEKGLVRKLNGTPPKWQLIKSTKQINVFKHPSTLDIEASTRSTVTNQFETDTIVQGSNSDRSLRRRRVSSLSPTSEQSLTKEPFEAPDFTSDFQFPAEYIKRMDNFSISDNQDSIQSTSETSSLNSQRYCSSSYPVSSDDFQAYGPRSKVPRLSDASSVKDASEELSSSKNPVSQLMEYAQANRLQINFEFSTHGPDHKKRFKSTVTLGAKTYPSIEGTSKKDAKNKAAASVLSILLQSSRHTSPTSSPAATPVQPVPNVFLAGNSSKNAISLVNEYAQANSLPINFQCDAFGPDHRRSFRTVLTIGSQRFEPVDASSKKDSKLKAAEAALAILQQTGRMAVSLISGGVSEPVQIKTFHDRVSMLVNQKFNELLMDLPDTMVGRKIVAGFVMSRAVHSEAGDETQWSVVSIGSGNRCVAGDKLSMQGNTVNDCHAEVIARRGLLRFFYKQLLAYKSDPSNTDNILTTSENDERLRVQDGVMFHLYISTAPCGDSALFAKSDFREGESLEHDDTDHQHCPLFENKKQGILRTKVENGEGCIPIDEDANVPTWDGLLRGERMRTMSCSDKLAKWNFLGLQGALLSHFLQPIYMSSLTLGMLYHHGHLTRAVCCRVEKYLKSLPVTRHSPLYRVNHPQVAKVSGDDPARDTGKIKTREFSLNWIVGDETAEVLDGTIGRCEARYGCTNPVSQVSKSSLYSHFKKLTAEKYTSYAKAKAAVEDYRIAGREMKEAFKSAECGTWMYKPAEVEDF